MLKVIKPALHINFQGFFPIEKKLKLLHSNILHNTKLVFCWLIQKTNLLIGQTIMRILMHFFGTNTTILELDRWIDTEL